MKQLAYTLYKLAVGFYLAVVLGDRLVEELERRIAARVSASVTAPLLYSIEGVHQHLAALGGGDKQPEAPKQRAKS